MQRQPSIFSHLRDILILPFTVTVIVPYFIYNGKEEFIPNSILTKSVGLLILIPGLTLFLYTVFLFKTRGNGTLAPWSPTQKLVITGPYQYCRNPMITGVLFILLGEACIFHSTSILIWATAFILINTIFFILYEEPSLYKRFGDDYLTYKKNVPRWIPRLTPYRNI